MNLEAELTRLRHELQGLDWQLSRNLTRGPFAGLGPSVTTAGSYVRDAWRENRSRVDRIREALEASGPLAQSRVAQMFSTVDLSAVWGILISLCKDIALYYGGSVLTGAAIGGAIGAFAGGVGAAPGAAIGAGAGAKAGLWVLALLGLKSLAGDLIDKIPKMLRHYEQGIETAWGAGTGAGTPRWHERGQCVADDRSNGCFFAASELAQGHVILIAGLIMGLTAYLTRGRGERSALLKEVPESPRLGPRVATWLEQNAEKLAKPQGPRSSYGPRTGGPAVTPSQLRKEIEAQRKPRSAPPERKAQDHNAGSKSGGPGKWVRANEHMSSRARRYQEQITGKSGQAYEFNDVKFDGYKDGRLIEAKGPGYKNFVDRSGNFYDWFRGADALVSQATRQIASANGRPIAWYVAEQKAATAIRSLLAENSISGITVRGVAPIP